MILRLCWPTTVQNGTLLYREGLSSQGIEADVLLLKSCIGGLATADIHMGKSPSTTTKTALVVNVQTIVALTVLPYIGPVGTKVEALSGTAWQQLHTMGMVQVDP